MSVSCAVRLAFSAAAAASAAAWAFSTWCLVSRGVFQCVRTRYYSK
jgi:hypothetical protein